MKPTEPVSSRIVEVVERLDDSKYCYRDEPDIRWLVVERDRLLARVRELEAENEGIHRVLERLQSELAGYRKQNLKQYMETTRGETP